MEDGLENRIRDLEGRPAEPGGDAGAGRRRERRSWPWGVIIATILVGLTAGRPLLERLLPWLNGPAPSWVGLLVLAMPVVAAAALTAVAAGATDTHP